jgi:hypothetical protein
MCLWVPRRAVAELPDNCAGVAVNEEASVEMEAIKGIWSLKPSAASEYHKACDAAL